MPSAVDICNRSLLSIGARAQISSISPSDGSTEGDACTILFQPTFQALARSARWNCLRQQVTLTLIAAAKGTPENPLGSTLPLPPTPWLYSYELPSDCLDVRFIVPSLPSSGAGIPQTGINNAAATVMPNGGAIPFQVAYGTDANNDPIKNILTNQSQAQVVYTVDQENPSAWDSLFQEAMVSSLAAYLVPALSLNLPLLQLSVSRAEALINRARAADGNEGVTVMDHEPDWIKARGSMGRAQFWNTSWTQGGYSEMPWPMG
jgi:hypothetical protein